MLCLHVASASTLSVSQVPHVAMAQLLLRRNNLVLSAVRSSLRCRTPVHAFRSGPLSRAAVVAALSAGVPGPHPAAVQSRRLVTAMATANAMVPPPKVALEPAQLPSVSISTSKPLEWEGDLLVLAVTEEDLQVEGADADKTVAISSQALKDLDTALSGVVSELLSGADFEAKQGSTTKVVRVLGSKAKNVALLGLGSSEKLGATPEWGASPFQAAGAAVAGLAKANKLSNVGLAFVAPVDASAAAGAVAKLSAGALLGGYESTRFKSKAKPGGKLQQLTLLGVSGGEAAVKEGTALALGNLLARYLVEAPPNVCTPTHLADAAAHIAAAAPEVYQLEVLDAAACAAMGMGCYLGVAEASLEPAKFIHLTYKPKGEVKKKIAVVGKGLTFDSGGYNLKAGPGSMIELMKFDMGGAAATLGAARILAGLQPEGVEVHFIIASCENMVSGRGLRPGDILTAANGKTVEVNNTDAEGRLTLADALWFAQEKAGVTAVVDIATLTGACIIALGGEVAGLFTPSDDMAASLSAASKASGEKVWRMPMEASYFDQLKSSVADMKNTGGRAGGSITAALFLKEYVNKGVEWAHLDIAGPVWNEKEALPTGYGAMLLAEWAAAQGK